MKKLSKNLKNNSGLTLVEVLIATSIILVFLLALFGANNLYLKTAFSNGDVIKGIHLAEEGLEAVRFLRNASWDNNIATLLIGTDYYPIFESGAWQLTTTPVFIDNTFERIITFSAVYRDAFSDIVTSGGILDPDTLLVTSAVSWPAGGATITKSISTYIANIFDE